MPAAYRSLLATCVLVACSLDTVAAASTEDATALLDEYGKPDLIELLLDKCYGEVTINRPFPKQVYGRPAADRIDARTFAHDMKRCRFSLDDAHAWLERRGALRNRRDVERVITGPALPATTAPAAGGPSSIAARLKRLERDAAKRRYEEQRRKAEGERLLERERVEAMSEEERAAEKRERDCATAKKLRDRFRRYASEASSLAARQRFRERADALKGAVRANCKSVL